MKKKYFLIIKIFICIVFFSCASTSSTLVKIIKPADINIPTHIKKLGIVDRSHPDKQGKAFNVIEGMLSGESAYQDKYTANEALGGVIFELSKTERFTVYQIQGINLTNNSINYFSAPLDWDIVKEICIKNEVDALIVLEIFDTNKNLSWNTENQSIVKNGITQTQIMHVANMNTEVITGWRVYDPENETVVDEFRLSENKSSSARGVSTYDAESALPQYSSVVAELARKNGEHYGLRIAPVAMMVNRYFYTGGDPRMQDSKMLINAQNYKEAAKMWEDVYVNCDQPKVKGRAAHNIAVAYETEGQVDKAIEWAQKAIESGNKGSKYYLKTLQQRKIDDETARKQLE